jgi:hypothetical protein
LPGRNVNADENNIIYYWMTADEQLWMLFGYAKTKKKDLAKTQLKALREIVERWKK